MRELLERHREIIRRQEDTMSRIITIVQDTSMIANQTRNEVNALRAAPFFSIIFRRFSACVWYCRK